MPHREKQPIRRKAEETLAELEKARKEGSFRTIPIDAPKDLILQHAKQIFETTGFNRHAGIKLVDVRPGYAKVMIAAREEVMRSEGMIHGGAVAMLVDCAGGFAMISEFLLKDQPEAPVRSATVNLVVTYLNPAIGEDIEAEARVIKKGRSLVVTDVDVHTPSGVHVAKGVVTYKV